MCQPKLRLLLVLLLCLLPLRQASPLVISLTKLHTQSQRTNCQSCLIPETFPANVYMTNLSNDSGSLTDSGSRRTQSQSQPMNASDLLSNQDKLLDSLEEQWKGLESQVQTLRTQSSNLERDNSLLNSMLESSKKTIDDLKSNLDDYKKALASNKEDTGYIVGLFAEAQQEIASIKTYVAKLERDKRKLRNARITSLGFAAVGVGSIVLANSLPVSQEIKNCLNGLGIGMVAASGITIGVTFLF